MPRDQFPNVCASADGRWIAGGFTHKRGDTVALWDARSGRLCFETPLHATLTMVALCTSTKTLAAEYLTSSLETKIRLFDLRTGACRATITPHTEPYVSTNPEFNTEGELLLQTNTHLEWWHSQTGRLLRSQRVPQSREGFLLSTRPCGRYRIAKHINTNPNQGIDFNEARFGLEVLSEREGQLQSVLLKDALRLLAYATDPVRERVAILLEFKGRLLAQVYQIHPQRLLATATFSQTGEENLAFSSSGSLLYVGYFNARVYVGNHRARVWDWEKDSVRTPHPGEVRAFSTFFLGKREVYNQYWDGAIRDARTDRLVVRLRSR